MEIIYHLNIYTLCLTLKWKSGFRGSYGRGRVVVLDDTVSSMPMIYEEDINSLQYNCGDLVFLCPAENCRREERVYVLPEVICGITSGDCEFLILNKYSVVLNIFKRAG